MGFTLITKSESEEKRRLFFRVPEASVGDIMYKDIKFAGCRLSKSDTELLDIILGRATGSSLDPKFFSKNDFFEFILYPLVALAVSSLIGELLALLNLLWSPKDSINLRGGVIFESFSFFKDSTFTGIIGPFLMEGVGLMIRPDPPSILLLLVFVKFENSGKRSNCGIWVFL